MRRIPLLDTNRLNYIIKVLLDFLQTSSRCISRVIPHVKRTTKDLWGHLFVRVQSGPAKSAPTTSKGSALETPSARRGAGTSVRCLLFKRRYTGHLWCSFLTIWRARMTQKCTLSLTNVFLTAACSSPLRMWSTINVMYWRSWRRTIG